MERKSERVEGADIENHREKMRKWLHTWGCYIYRCYAQGLLATTKINLGKGNRDGTNVDLCYNSSREWIQSLEEKLKF